MGSRDATEGILSDSYHCMKMHRGVQKVFSFQKFSAALFWIIPSFTCKMILVREPGSLPANTAPGLHASLGAFGTNWIGCASTYLEKQEEYVSFSLLGLTSCMRPGETVLD